MTKYAQPKIPQFKPKRVRDVSEAVYKMRLEAGSRPAGAVDRMIEEHGADKLRDAAGSYDSLTRVYLTILGEKP